jgi:hypothetical protein
LGKKIRLTTRRVDKTGQNVRLFLQKTGPQNEAIIRAATERKSKKKAKASSPTA